MKNDQGPTELPAFEPFDILDYFLLCEDPRLEQHTPAGDGLWLCIFFSITQVLCLTDASQEAEEFIVCNAVYMGFQGNQKYLKRAILRKRPTHEFAREWCNLLE